MAEAVRRLIRAVGRRIATDGNPEWLDELVAMQAQVEASMTTAVDGLRAAGFSDAEIGRPLGITRQAVQKRWPTDPRPRRPIPHTTCTNGADHAEHRH